MTTCFSATAGVDVITTTAAIPALGSIAINAFVLHGTEPVLVDTGTVAGSADFMAALASVIDSSDLRWIWLTHTSITSALWPHCSRPTRTCGSSRRSSASGSWGCRLRPCRWTGSTSSTPASR